MSKYQHPRGGPANKHRRHAHSSRTGRTAAAGPLQLYGLHAVEAALRNPKRRIISLLATENAALKLADAIAARGVTPTPAAAEKIAARLPDGAVHQGVLAEVEAFDPVSLQDLAPASPIIALDQVTDPQNVGAILRSAAAFGAAAVIAPDRGAPAASGALAKAATGALEHVPYLQIGNLARTLEDLKKAGYWIVGLAGEGDTALETVADRTPLVLVLGAEGSGLRRLTRERCDVLARLDLPGPIKALNVSNAAAVALYAVTRARPDAAPA